MSLGRLRSNYKDHKTTEEEEETKTSEHQQQIFLHLSPVPMSNNLYHQNWKDIFYICQHITKYF